MASGARLRLVSRTRMRLPVDGRDPQVVLPPLSGALRIEVDVEDGRVLAVRGDRNHVVSQGYLCVKGRELAEQHTHPARIRGARKRMPDGGFADIDFIYGVVETTTDVLPGVVSMAHARGGEPEPSVPSDLRRHPVRLRLLSPWGRPADEHGTCPRARATALCERKADRQCEDRE